MLLCTVPPQSEEKKTKIHIRTIIIQINSLNEALYMMHIFSGQMILPPNARGFNLSPGTAIHTEGKKHGILQTAKSFFLFILNI